MWFERSPRDLPLIWPWSPDHTGRSLCPPQNHLFTEVVVALIDVGYATLLRKGVWIVPTVQISAEGHAPSRTLRRLHVSPAKFPLRTIPFSQSRTVAQKGLPLAICCVHGHAFLLIRRVVNHVPHDYAQPVMPAIAETGTDVCDSLPIMKEATTITPLVRCPVRTLCLRPSHVGVAELAFTGCVVFDIVRPTSRRGVSVTLSLASTPAFSFDFVCDEQGVDVPCTVITLPILI